MIIRSSAMVFLFGLMGCVHISGHIPPPVPIDDPAWEFRVGAAKVDITPIPGIPTGGHGVIGQTARGYWTRLFARAIYSEDPHGQAMVLVACDLWSIPGALADRVAELISKEPGTRHLGREQIVLAAQARRPAIAHLLKGRVTGLSRNRSYAAFVLNGQESLQILEENASLPVGTLPTRYGESPRNFSLDDLNKGAYRAVDPRLRVLRFTSVDSPPETIAVAAFVSLHNTSMPHTMEVYSSDLFGVAATMTENRLRPEKVPLSVYRFGDIVLATLPGEFTLVMGRRIEQHIQQIHPDYKPGEVILIGLANEYVSYFTTSEEYDAQHYEGASTLYGPNAGSYVGYRLGELTKTLASSARQATSRWYFYKAGLAKHFSISDIGGKVERIDDGLTGVLVDLKTGLPLRNMPSVCWKDVRPELATWPYESDVRVTPSVEVQEKSRDRWSTLEVAGEPQTDRGLSFITVALDSRKKTSKWCTFWITPTPYPPSKNPLRFHVETIGNGELCKQIGPPTFSPLVSDATFHTSSDSACVGY